MKIPKVNTKFVYTAYGLKIYLALMMDDENFKDIGKSPYFENNSVGLAYSFNFKDYFGEFSDIAKFISEVNSLEEAKELYPELFI